MTARDPNPDRDTPPPGIILGLMMVCLMACQLLVIFAPSSAAQWGTRILVLAIPLVGIRRLRLREFYLLGFSAALLLLAWIRLDDLATTLLRGLDRASFLAAFILLMGLLREGGITSPAVRDAGAYVTQQPPRQRFLAVFMGSHFFSVLINLGALSLLAPIIQRGVRGDQSAGAVLDEIQRVRERRQLTALLRGFAWFLVWAPTAVTQAILPTLIPGIEAGRLMAVGLVVALVMLIVSWAEDMLRWWPLRRRLRSTGRLPQRVAQSYPSQAFLRLGCVSVLLFGLTLVFSTLAGVSLVSGVMLAAPLVLLTWVYTQQAGHTIDGKMAGTARRLIEISRSGLPSFVREAVSLSAAGFIGTLAARLVPAEQVAALLAVEQMPVWLFLFGLSFAVWLGGQIALSPITTAVFLGSLVADLSDLPVDATLVALAIAAGTAICTTGAPFASGTLMLSRVSGYSGVDLAWRWNLPYTLVTMVVLAVLYAGLAELT